MDNALRILDLLGEHAELGASDVSRLLSIGKSTAFRLLVTLENRHFIKKEVNNKYRLGMKFAYLGSISLNRTSIIRVAHPFLQELSTQVKENCNLVILEDDYNVRFIDKVKAPTSLRMETFVGITRPAYCTATGKVLLAFQSEKVLEQYLTSVSFEKFTDVTINNADHFRTILEQTRKNGYACNIGESEVGLIAYAVPVLDLSGRAMAAISVAGPTERMKLNKGDILNRLKTAAAGISNHL